MTNQVKALRAKANHVVVVVAVVAVAAGVALTAKRAKAAEPNLVIRTTTARMTAVLKTHLPPPPR